MAPAIHDGTDNAVVDNSFITQIHVSCICMYRVWKPRAKTLHKGMKCQVPSWTAKFSLSLHLATETHFNLLVVLYPLLGNYCPSRIELCGPVQKQKWCHLAAGNRNRSQSLLILWASRFSSTEWVTPTPTLNMDLLWCLQPQQCGIWFWLANLLKFDSDTLNDEMVVSLIGINYGHPGLQNSKSPDLGLFQEPDSPCLYYSVERGLQGLHHCRRGMYKGTTWDV